MKFHCCRGIGARPMPRPPGSHHTLQLAWAAREEQSSTPHSHIPKPTPKWCIEPGFDTSVFSFWGHQVTADMGVLGGSSGSGNRRHPVNRGMQAMTADGIKRRVLGRSPRGPLPALTQLDTQDSQLSLLRRRWEATMPYRTPGGRVGCWRTPGY